MFPESNLQFILTDTVGIIFLPVMFQFPDLILYKMYRRHRRYVTISLDNTFFSFHIVSCQ